MLSTMDILQLKVRARDGHAGSIRDLIFSEADWTVRDLEIDTGAWISGRRVVVGPDELLEADAPTRTLDLVLSREEIKALPETPGGESVPPGLKTVGKPREAIIAAETAAAPDGNERLHRLSEVLGYEVMCDIETAGRVEGFLIDTVAWDMPLALVRLAKTEDLVLLPSRLISAITWPERSVQTTVEASILRNAPMFDSRIQDERVFLPVVTDYYASHSAA